MRSTPFQRIPSQEYQDRIAIMAEDLQAHLAQLKASCCWLFGVQFLYLTFSFAGGDSPDQEEDNEYLFGCAIKISYATFTHLPFGKGAKLKLANYN